MKRFFAGASILIFAAFTSAQADDRTTAEKARDGADSALTKAKEIARDTRDVVVDAARNVGKASREAWDKTKEYWSDDVPVYREGAVATVGSLEKEIALLKSRTPENAPRYFRTRIIALDEQYLHLTDRLAAANPELLKDRSSGPRYDFDQCVKDLEQAIDQAMTGAEMLAKTAPDTALRRAE